MVQKYQHNFIEQIHYNGRVNVSHDGKEDKNSFLKYWQLQSTIKYVYQ